MTTSNLVDSRHGAHILVTGSGLGGTGAGMLQVRLTPWQTLRLRQVSRREGMTPDMFLLTSFVAIRQRYAAGDTSGDGLDLPGNLTIQTTLSTIRDSMLSTYAGEEAAIGWIEQEGFEATTLQRLTEQLEAVLSDLLADSIDLGRNVRDLHLLREAERRETAEKLAVPEAWSLPRPPHGGPPAVRYEELFREEEGGWSLGSLFRKWRSRLFFRDETPQPEPLSRIVFIFDCFGLDSGEGERWIWKRSAHVRPTTEDWRAESWSTLFGSLCGDHLPGSTKESPDLWGRRLARSLLSPAGRIPELGSLQERVLIKALHDLPGWEQEKIQILPWVEKAAGHCVAIWRDERREPPPPLREVRWLPEERCGFFLNRVLSYPEQHLEEHEDGLRELGGLTRALGFAWMLLYRSLAALPMGWKLPLRRSRTTFLFELAEAVARAWRAEVRSDSLNFMNAFLVRSKSRSVIYLRKRLDHRRRAWGVCHELAHIVLGHASNSSYGLNPLWLQPEEALSFNRQEAAADALASLWLHLFEGLADLGFALQRSDRVRAAPHPRRLSPAPPGAIAWSGAARADPDPPSDPSPPPL